MSARAPRVPSRRLRAPRVRGARPGRRVLLALLSWLAALSLCVSAAAVEEPATAAPAVAQFDLDAALRDLQGGSLADAVPLSSLFAARLGQLAEVEARVAALRDEIRIVDAQVAGLRENQKLFEREQVGQALPGAPAQPDLEVDPSRAEELGAVRQSERARRRAELEAELVSLRSQRERAELRVGYLEALAATLRAMPEAARRILPAIAEPRAALREYAAALGGLAGALDAAAARLDALSVRVASGALVGFIGDAREAAAELDTAKASFSARAQQLRDLESEHLRLAEQTETEARGLRRSFLVSVLAPDRGARMDDVFLSHIESQRRLRRRISNVENLSDRRSFARLEAFAQQLAPRPRAVGSVSEARDVMEPVGELIAYVDAEIAVAGSALDSWRLAFHNEVVTLFSSQISPAAREQAYALSGALLRDVRAELELAWNRARARWEERSLAASASEAGGPAAAAMRGPILRWLAILAIAGFWWIAWRSTGRVVSSAVRMSASGARRHIGLRYGTLVRWSVLVEATLPVLLGFVALRAVMTLLDLGAGKDGAALLGAIALPFLWYALGRQLLMGATRQIGIGRPALIAVDSAQLPLLRQTYARLGLFIAVAAALHGIARIAIGEGVTVMLVDAMALTWIGVWAAWEAFTWRPTLARSWRASLPEESQGFQARLAAWMERSRWGFVLSAPVLFWGILTRTARASVAAFRTTDLAGILQARLLRRATRRQEADESEALPLPEAYLREFPLHPVLGEDDALLLPREETVKQILDQIEQWKETRSEGSLALVGEKGLGKTTLASLVARRTKDDVSVVQATLRGKLAGAEELFRQLGPSLPADGVSDFSDWIDGLCAGPERVVLLDEAHNVFLRTVGGYGAYDALIELVNATSDRIFWVLIFNSFTWRFLNESRSRLHYFRRLIEVPAWSADELRELIRRRHERTGFEVEFDEMLLSGERSETGRVELVEGADGFFRLLRESSLGNPRIATRLWLSSLRPIGEKKLRVGGFRETKADLDALSDDLYFALAALSQHENLSSDELRRVMNVSEPLARFAMRYLLEAGLVESKDGSSDRVTLAPQYYRQVLRGLRNKHLLFE